MKAHTSSFKEQIKLIGKEIDSKITFGDTVLGKDDLNAVTPSYQGSILKSVMKQLDIDSNVEIPIGTILKYEFGLKVNGEYEYINYGNYVVYSIEKQEDTNSYKMVCYDKLLYSMLDYVKLPITYPISVRDYINAISTALGLKFANKSGTFANYNKQIQADLYDGLGYTFRDILDELAQVTASTICLNNNDELEIRYITETGDTIDEEYLKDVNVNFGEKFGAVNTIVLSRSGDSDSVYYPEVLPANPYEIKISDNQIMNGNDRADFLPDIYNKLNGLEFYTNDFVSTGILYYDLCDRYSVKVGNNTYSCVMFNDEVLVTQGLEENVYTELPEQTETDYKHASKDDRMINQVYIIAKKNEAEILALVSTTETIQKEINPTKDESGSEIIIEDASNNPLTYLEIEGKSKQKKRSGKNLLPFEVGYTETKNGVTLEVLENGIKLKGTPTITSGYIPFNYYVSLPAGPYTVFFPENRDGIGVQNPSSNLNFGIADSNTIRSATLSSNVAGYGSINVRYDVGELNEIITPMLLKGTYNEQQLYEAYGVSPSPDYPSEIESVGYKNLLLNNETNQTINGITFTVNEDGTVVANGTASENATLVLNSGRTWFTDTGDFILNGSPNGASGNTYYLRFGGTNIYSDYGDGVKITENDASAYRYCQITIQAGITVNNLVFKPMITKGEKEHSYIPYGKYGIEVKTTNGTDIKSSIIILNEPLRSLPNGVKDIAYIKNNKLYVDRKVGSIILNGSENWTRHNDTRQLYYIPTTDIKIKKPVSNTIAPNVLCNYLKKIPYWVDGTNDIFGSENGISIDMTQNRFYIGAKEMDGVSDLATFKIWLSIHNTEVIYELATPVTEEIVEIEMPSTFKGVNHISTTDELEPIINLTYVRDTVIADYVENHVAELKLTENEIKASVENVSSSVDGLNTTINRVEEITTDNSQVINIISTNIDQKTGEVREVTTTTGFTFNADGMTIDDGSGFKGEHTAQGTFYKDGETVTGQYTKDGSKQKDLELFGTYSYGKENIDDTPMFIAQLYKDENGEECFGHFYNGGGY